MEKQKRATGTEDFTAAIARRQLSALDWQAAIDEKLRRRDFLVAGYEDIPAMTLALARQIERWEV